MFCVYVTYTADWALSLKYFSMLECTPETNVLMLVIRVCTYADFFL